MRTYRAVRDVSCIRLYSIPLAWGAAGSLWWRPQRKGEPQEAGDPGDRVPRKRMSGCRLRLLRVDSMTSKLLTYPSLAKG